MTPLTRLTVLCRKLITSNKRLFHNSSPRLEERIHPYKRALQILANDFKLLNKSKEERSNYLANIFPHHVDIVIIGGAAVGSSIAYFLKHKTGLEGLSIAVIEKDKTYGKCSTVLSVGGLRQQFSLPENIHMSLYGAEFIRTLKKRFGQDADVYFTPNGYSMLASERGAQQLIDNAKLQNELGAINVILGKESLKNRFPWMNVTDIEVGCVGLEKEGWFDPWALLHIIKREAQRLGTRYITGKAMGFTFKKRQDMVVDGRLDGSYEGLDELMVELPNGDIKSMKFAYCIIAAGCESGEVAKLAKIGCGKDMLTVPLPVEKRKRYVYCFDCQDEGPGLNTPLTIDYTGTYFRRDGLGGCYIGGLSPTPEEEPDTKDLEVDHQYFEERVWPALANRVPAFNTIKVRSAWSGYYDYNVFDENGIIGPHPYYYNLYFATGFSGHGIQQAPAVGRAIAEHILDGQFTTIDLTRLGFDRLMLDKPMYEVCIV